MLLLLPLSEQQPHLRPKMPIAKEVLQDVAVAVAVAVRREDRWSFWQRSTRRCPAGLVIGDCSSSSGGSGGSGIRRF